MLDRLRRKRLFFAVSALISCVSYFVSTKDARA